MANLKQLEGGRAAFAYKCALQGKDLGKDYKSHVKNIPMMIKTNGLGAAFAFMKSKEKEKTYKLLYKQTHDWLKENLALGKTFSKNDDLVKVLIELDSSSYRAVTIEVLALFNWLKRFSDGLIEKENK
ncbi:type III-B CRISPR module-associated protein Cmr5 [Aureispira sp. CCB-E]|uniref:type III-B CRISPR module-associated protein Cmr5 n=1 Tax=Aureispira sp. CCB-E TaxID=3051121 RepID=UPI0028690E28|nr:type III-B CRISPR module-associated protein Cmr5 [Aureispira sp. CCB-E]WMX17569.1 type III-B CRISPR module-associated protein Cmr5 [Aureispira sp. CCB-E]